MAREDAARGRGTVGYVGDVVPTELIEAAGLQPVHLTGRGRADTPLVDRYIRPNRGTRDSDVTVDAVLETILDGSAGELDRLVIPHISRSHQGIPLDLAMAREAGLSVPPVHYLDRSYLCADTSLQFNRRQFDKLVRSLSTWGERITGESLEEVLAHGRVYAAELTSLSEARRRPGSPVAGATAVDTVLSSQRVGVEEGSRVLQRAGSTMAGSTPGLPEVFLGGHAVDHSLWHAEVESAGCRVIAEDAPWSLGGDPVPTVAGIDPLEILRTRYASPDAEAMVTPMSIHISRTLARVEASGARRAVFIVPPGDHRMWEVPTLCASLERLGVRTLHLKNQPYAPTGNAAPAEAIHTFLTEEAAA